MAGAGDAKCEDSSWEESRRAASSFSARSNGRYSRLDDNRWECRWH